MSDNCHAVTAVAPTPPTAASGTAVDVTAADADQWVAGGTAAWRGDAAAATTRGVPGTSGAVAAAASRQPGAAGGATPPVPTASSAAAVSRAAASCTSTRSRWTAAAGSTSLSSASPPSPQWHHPGQRPRRPRRPRPMAPSAPPRPRRPLGAPPTPPPAINTRDLPTGAARGTDVSTPASTPAAGQRRLSPENELVRGRRCPRARRPRWMHHPRGLRAAVPQLPPAHRRRCAVAARGGDVGRGWRVEVWREEVGIWNVRRKNHASVRGIHEGKVRPTALISKHHDTQFRAPDPRVRFHTRIAPQCFRTRTFLQANQDFLPTTVPHTFECWHEWEISAVIPPVTGPILESRSPSRVYKLFFRLLWTAGSVSPLELRL